jgi:hypothetical protein
MQLQTSSDLLATLAGLAAGKTRKTDQAPARRAGVSAASVRQAAGRARRMLWPYFDDSFVFDFFAPRGSHLDIWT